MEERGYKLKQDNELVANEARLIDKAAKQREMNRQSKIELMKHN